MSGALYLVPDCLCVFVSAANVGGMAAVGLCRRPGVSWSDLTRNERNRVGLLALVDASSGVCLITGPYLVLCVPVYWPLRHSLPPCPSIYLCRYHVA